MNGIPNEAATNSFAPPAWLLVDHGVEPERYRRWLTRKAQSLRRRDKKRDGKDDRRTYERAIHEAVLASMGKDHWTGDLLHWHRIGEYDNELSRMQRGAYKRELALLPTVDHVDAQAVADFVICGWRTNDAKNDMSADELVAFCRLALPLNLAWLIPI